MRSGSLLVRLTALSVCAALSLSLISLRADAGDNKGNKDRIIIHIGTPAVWSLGQAHYLLAKMQKNNLELQTNMPDRNALDPNAINATKIQILKTLLDVEAQFSEKIGVENRAALDEFKDKLRRRDEARADLDRAQEELDNTNLDLKRMNKRLARLNTEYTQIKTERERPRPNPDKPGENLPTPPPGDEENGLQEEIAVLNAKIAAKEKEKTAQEAEVKDLTTRANGDVGKPALSEVSLGQGGSLPEPSDFIKARIKKVVESMSDPRFAASIVLDNFIGMQYEIIAKQLTLLRDEVGPQERIVFLELPSSVYSVACKGDEHIAQVQWEVTQYYDDKDLRHTDEYDSIYKERRTQTEDEQNYEPPKDYIKIKEDVTEGIRKYKGDVANWQKNRKTKPDELRPVEPLSDKGCNPLNPNCWKLADSSTVRAVDIIPRQSALNINEVQSTTSQVNFLGVMKLLIGFGLRVNYQRQRELYEQYLQQEVFASGFGKGRNAFGWTFGPQPGTKRISPGVRTTYAALVIPRTASLLRLRARGVAFHRKEAPALIDDMIPVYEDKSDHAIFEDEFAIIIPNEKTEQFRLDSIHYTPAKKGDPISVVVKGSYFSPQAGILVDGVPLIKSLSLGNTATSTAINDPPGTGIRGQYELVSSREMVMKFSMPETYVGTPNITLVTPEKSSALNFINLLINDHRPNTTLRDLVVTEPMFMPAFSLQDKLFDLRDDLEDSKYKLSILKGTGLRRRAEVWVNGNKLTLFRKLARERDLIGKYFDRSFPKESFSQVGSEIGMYRVRDKLADEYANLICPTTDQEGKDNAKTKCQEARDDVKRRKYIQLLDDHKLYEAIKAKEVEYRFSIEGNTKTKEAIEAEVEKEYSRPANKEEEYVEEQTTGEYFLRFLKKTPEKYAVKYRQNAIFNVESVDFVHKEEVTPEETAVLRNYIPNQEENTALVDIRFKAPATKKIITARVSPKAAGELEGSIDSEGENSYRGLFRIKYDKVGSVFTEKQNMSVTVSYGDNTFKDSKTHDIVIPLRPQVIKTTLNVAVTGDGEGQVISLEGINLQRITKVKVGDKEADIIGAPDQGILIIKLPKGMTIKKDVAVQIPLILETADGTKVSVIATVGKPKTGEAQSAEQKEEKQ